MDTYDIRGTVHKIGDTQTFGSGFTKRDLILSAQDGAYTNLYGVTAIKDNVTRFDPLKVGDDVTATVFANTLAKVREYEGRWFSDMPTCFKVHVNGEAQQPASEANLIDDDQDTIPF